MSMTSDGGTSQISAVWMSAGANVHHVAVGTSPRSDLSNIQKGEPEMKDCYDCEFAEFDTETYYGGGKQKIVTGCKSTEFCKHSLSVGDIIKCRDKDDAVSTSMELAMHGVHTDFKYELCGEQGLWLEITEIEEDE